MKQNRKRSERRPVKRLCPTPETGLTEEQAAQRRAAGWNNAAQDSLSKTEWQIVRDNVFTFFNFVFVALAACLFAVGAYRDMMFLGIVAANVFIGIVQELRVKRTLDKVTLLSGSTACVVRGGRTRTVPTDELVLDDIVLLRPGSQVCADAVVADGTLEVNEALLTGEAELVQKRPGDTLLSGSFVVTGACAAQLDKVGTDCYAARITGEARRRKRHRSEMMRALDRLLRFISIAIIPVFVIMFAKQYFFLHTGLEYAMSSTVAAIIGMIPEGLYLLVSVALAVSVISLARSKTLVHELSCIENLARVDTLCLDKTGTITEGCMEVLETIPVPGMEGGALAELLHAPGIVVNGRVPAPDEEIPGGAMVVITGSAAPSKEAKEETPSQQAAPLKSACTVTLNGKPVTLAPKADGTPHYVMDLLERSGIDFKRAQHPVSLWVNGGECSFQQVLQEGDRVDIGYEDEAVKG